MRDARAPQTSCGHARAFERLHTVERRGAAWLRAFACVAVMLPALAATSLTAHAQDTSGVVSAPKSKGSFPKQAGGPFGKMQRPDTAKPLHLQADQLVYDNTGNRVTARGNVEIFFDNNILTADEVIYDQSADTLEAIGNVYVKDPNGNIIRADRYTLTSDFRDGFVQQLSAISRDDTRIAAQEAVRRDGNVTEFKNGKFSPCKSEGGMPPLWCIGAARIIHDVQAASITYHDAQFELFGVPVMYFPYFQHADPSVKRRSGFLPPGISMSSDTLGFTTEVPYYMALNPSYDFLFHPMYSSKQGVLWQGDWRQRLANGEYWVKFAAIDQDISKLDSPSDDLEGWRGSIETRGKFSLGSFWNLGWDAIIESDDSFRRFYKLDSILLTDRVNQLYLVGMSEKNYFSARMYHFGGLTFSDSNDAESVVHPIIDHRYIFDDVLGGELTWSSNVLQFGRENVGNTDRRQDMTRAITELSWRRKLTDSIGITYTPFGEVRGDAYQVSDYIDPTLSGPATNRVVADETVVRGNAAAGVTVAYPWIANSPGISHVLEPIGQIIGRNATTDQRRMPNEDARSLVFDDSNLFDINKFSGYDRIETGTRANVGLQYTFQTNSGGSARLLVGQSFHLAGTNAFANSSQSCTKSDGSVVVQNVAGYDADCNPIFNPSSGLGRDRSDYVIGLYLAPTDIFRVITQNRFDEDSLRLRRNETAAQFNLGPFSSSAVYSYSAADPQLGIVNNQQDIVGSVGLRVTDHWSVHAAMRYDIDADFRLSDSLTVKYSDECFVLTATYQEAFYTDRSLGIEPDRSIMLRFEFKHLGQYNYKTDTLDFVTGEQQTR